VLLGLVTVLGWCSLAAAEPVTVRFTEGVTRGFPILRSVKGEKLAHGDLVQVARGDRVESRLVFRFSDGSLHDETVVYSQQGVFKVLSYRLVQRGPSFPETLEATIDRETERYEVRYRGDEDSPEQVLRGRFTLPESGGGRRQRRPKNRSVYFSGAGWVDCPCVERERLAGRNALVVKKKGMIKTYINFEPNSMQTAA